MSEGLAEVALLEDARSLPAQMQKVYMQLLSAIDCSLAKLRPSGAAPEQLSEEFIDKLLNQLLQQSLSRQALQDCVDSEFLRQILRQSELTAEC